MGAVHFSSETDQWATPQALFDRMNTAFGFTLDVCADSKNAKCPIFFSKEQDGLAQEWVGRCWMNPPYGRAIGLWVKKAFLSAQQGALVVALLPARVDTKWWHDYVMGADVHFIKGRIKFGAAKSGAPFPSAIALFWPKP